MKFIGQSQETDALHATHSIFFEQNIENQTPKAWKIRVRRFDGSIFFGWVPKSRTLALTFQDHKNPKEPKTKFFIPKYFTR